MQRTAHNPHNIHRRNAPLRIHTISTDATHRSESTQYPQTQHIAQNPHTTQSFDPQFTPHTLPIPCPTGFTPHTLPIPCPTGFTLHTLPIPCPQVSHSIHYPFHVPQASHSTHYPFHVHRFHTPYIALCHATQD
ncbi:hypothetical protein AVEN_164265-1 [Araneus ventricosus]|uniref:Uncharacterized protein n=1 Tax=Araneus ventricosus TaxID=182803 RepID=A0A4Y2I2F1_ARAVE|nr:hypothetical protein AVEN_164265-1 [Araneus ventricosus]